MPADDDHDDEEDTGDGYGDKEHNEGRHTGEGSSKIICIRQSYVFKRLGICHVLADMNQSH